MRHSTAQSGQLVIPVGAEDHQRGDSDAPSVLVEYADFECPYCAEAREVVETLRAELGDRLLYVFRHFPLREKHAHALRAAEVAEAAGMQGHFWEMHDLLFENQDALEDEDLLDYAETLGLDVSKLERNLQNALRRVLAQSQGGSESGVSGTPTFFVNGFRHEGEYDPQTLLAALRPGP